MGLSHHPSNSLPTRFPIGARYVIEGRGGQDGHFCVSARYVILPGGRRIKLPADTGELPAVSAQPARRRGRNGAKSQHLLAKKIFRLTGTRRQQRH